MNSPLISNLLKSKLYISSKKGRSINKIQFKARNFLKIKCITNK